MTNLIMPYLRGKIKEEIMTLQEQLLDLDVTVNRISRGIHAVFLISRGLDQAVGPDVDGLDAICEYLSDSDKILRKQLDCCLDTVRQSMGGCPAIFHAPKNSQLF